MLLSLYRGKLNSRVFWEDMSSVASLTCQSELLGLLGAMCFVGCFR